MSGCRATERPQMRSVSFFTGKLSGDTRIHQSWLVSQHFYGGWIEMDRNAFGFWFRCEPLWKEHKSIIRTSTWRHWIDLAGVLNGSSSLYVPGWRAYSGAKGLCVGFLTALDSIDSRESRIVATNPQWVKWMQRISYSGGIEYGFPVWKCRNLGSKG